MNEKKLIKRMIVMLIVAGVVIGGVVAFQLFKNKMIGQAIQAQANPPQTVSTLVVEKSAWQPITDALGSFVATEQAVLSAEVGGLVTAIHFDSGHVVKGGQVLVELNAKPLKAQLKQYQAEAELAAIDLERDQELLETRAVSQSVVDTDRANLKAAEAKVAAQEALIAQKTIAAPFSGQLGIRQVNLGQFLAAGDPVVTIQRIDPMEIDFNIPQDEIGLIETGRTAELDTSGAPGQSFTATMIAIEPQIDPQTRNITVRARVPNPDHVLLPGMFATVHLRRGEPRDYVTVPNAAIAYNAFGSTVFVVKSGAAGLNGQPQLTVEQRFVTTGPTRGDQVAVIDGLEPGETVVTAGQVKLRNGSPIKVNNEVQPANDPNPQVSES